MSRRSVKLIIAGTIVACAGAYAATIPPLPPTPAEKTVDVIHGTKVLDPYRWLENATDPKVDAWINAQNARTRAYLDALPDREAIKNELTRLITTTSPSYSHLSVNGGSVFAIYVDTSKQQPLLVALNAQADPKSRRTVLDPNALDPSGRTAIDWFVSSHDGKYVAVSLSKNGSEDGTLHVYEVGTGKEIGSPIPRVQYPTAGGSLAWNSDGSGFWYTRYPGPEAPEADRHFNVQVYFHGLGSNPKDDTLALRTQDGLERISEVFLDNRYGRTSVVAMVQRGDGGEWAHYVLSADQAPLRLSNYEDKVVYSAIGPDDAIYAISRKDAPNGKIVKLKRPFTQDGLASAPVIVPESSIAILSGGAPNDYYDLTLTAKRLFVRDIVGGPNQIRIFDHDGKPSGVLPFPEISSNQEIEPLANGEILFDVNSYLRPRHYLKWDGKSQNAKETALRIVSPVSFADCTVEREFATSKDGTRIPINIIHKKTIKLDGTNPALLYGYGGYGVSVTPGFLGPMWRLWIDAGGVLAIANIRGGGEYGERWHQQGMLTNKQNVFDDFYAAAEYLIGRHYTSPAKLALRGRSNGGLLMGAMVTQHPEIARAISSAVGVYDMVRAELEPNGSFNTTEYGTVKDAQQFKALYAYSPYHHVEKGVAYPAVLLMTGANDGRVNPLNSRKFGAALQSATSTSMPIFLRTTTGAGHGIGSSLSERIAEQTDELTFLLDQLGMHWTPPPVAAEGRAH